MFRPDRRSERSNHGTQMGVSGGEWYLPLSRKGEEMSDKIINRIDFDPEFEPLLSSAVLIPRRVLEGMSQAKSILNESRKEASEIRKRAHEILEEAKLVREEERKRGYEEGHEEGLAEWSQKILEAGSAYEKILKDAEPQMIQMIMNIAEKVIGRAVEQGAILDVIRKAVSEATGKKITVRVHPSDLVFVKKREKEMMNIVDQNESLTFREDESVSVGGCIVETELGTVDARLELQLTAIRKVFGL